MFHESLACLQIPLPEDIWRMEGMGDLDRAQRIIDLRLHDDALPGALRERLRLEKQMLRRMPGEYPYGFAQALAIAREELAGFDEAELNAAIDGGRVNWICLNGEVRLHRLFLDTLIKVRPELAPRVVHPERLAYKKQNFAVLDDMMREMQKNGGAARRWHMRHTLKIRPECFREGRPVLVHLPLPVEYDCVRNFRLLDCGPVPGEVSNAAQRTIAFRKSLEKDDVFFAEYAFEVHMRWRDLRPEPARGGIPEGEDCLGEQPPHIAFTPLVASVAREIAGDETNPLLLARRVYDFLTTRPIYSYVRSYFTYPSLTETMLTSMKGDCGIFALAFITLCRCIGVPARWQSGLYCAPHDVGCHDWAQFYCEPWGWLPVDASFGNAAWHNGDQARWNFYFGNMDPFRLPAARAFQSPFDPPKRYLRSDPYDNQNGEAEYDDCGLTSGQFEERCTLIDWEALPVS